MTSHEPESTPTWEICKENTAPLERGRDVRRLNTALDVSVSFTAEQQKQHQRQKRHFERLVAPSESPETSLGDSDDPLIHWLSYIKFTQDAFPSDTRSCFLLLERCARAFLHRDRYANDVRYIRVCILYADKTQTSFEIFQFLYSQNIGRSVSLFWVAWAWVAEKDKQYKMVEKVFSKAKKAGAKPKKLLEERERQFQRRMSRLWLSSNEDREEEEEENEEDNRAALGGLSKDGIKHNDRSRQANREFYTDENGVSRERRGTDDRERPSSSRTIISSRASRRTDKEKATNGVKPQSTFAIFQDENGNGEPDLDELEQSHQWKGKLAKESDRRKENTLEAEQWSKRGALMKETVGEPVRGRAATTPTFEVFVEEEAQREPKQPPTEKVKNSSTRSLRQLTTGGGMADKLNKDPLRYIRNPEKLDSDFDKQKIPRQQPHISKATSKKTNSQSIQPPTKELASLNCGFHRNLLHAKHNKNEECSFEQSRAVAKYYKLVDSSTNFNLLEEKSAPLDTSNMSLEDDDESMDNSMEMEDSTMQLNLNYQVKLTSSKNDDCYQNDSPPQYRTANNGPRRNLSLSATKSPISEINNKNNSPLNDSNASSTFAENDCVGLPTMQDPTINTQFAMRELSMMFSSPQSDKNGLPEERGGNDIQPLLFQDEEAKSKRPLFAIHEDKSGIANGDTATFSVMADLMIDDKVNPDNSTLTSKGGDAGHSFQVFCDENQDDAPSGFPSKKSKNIGGSKESFVVFEEGDHENNVKQPFPIYEEDSKSQPFSIFDDSCKNSPSSEPDTPPIDNGGGFTIFQEDTSENVALPKQKKPPKQAFSIFTESSPERNHQDSVGNTASLSIFGEAIKDLVCDDDNLPTDTRRDKSKTSGNIGFEIFHERDIMDIKNVRIDEGEEIIEGVEKKDKQVVFSIFCDSGDTAQKQGYENMTDDFTSCGIPPKGNIVTDQLKFGDISHIAPRHETCTPLPLPPPSSLPEPIDYRILHKEDVLWALDESMDEAARSSAFNSSISPDTYEWSGADPGPIDDRRSQSIPKSFLSKTPKKGTQIDLGGVTVCLKHELGRGAYGVVMLCDINSSNSPNPNVSVLEYGNNNQEDTSSTVALKVQVPTGSLAWEYHILNKLEERLPQNRANDRRKSILPQDRQSQNNYLALPFPRALSLAAYADGALFGMTAGSKSGWNLVDVVNSHKTNAGRGGPVPELLALHYTARMLMHMECLHWHGKILHCDVKPDNWVLTASKNAHHCSLDNHDDNDNDELIQGSDLMLVDFGRAIDLTTASPPPLEDDETAPSVDPLQLQFTGDISAQDMACISMRENRPWGADVDTFGLCASAYVLLYGSYMQVEKVNGIRWMPQKPLRRYWNKELWHDLFDTLLNLDCGHEASSHPNILRRLRKKIEAFLDSGSRRKELVSLLRYQAGMLPRKR